MTDAIIFLTGFGLYALTVWGFFHWQDSKDKF
jgi:hypothetical protein